jgi:hypothetical protein
MGDRLVLQDEAHRTETIVTRTGFIVRLGLSIVLDLLDFTVGRVLIGMPWEEGAGAALSTILWGPAGIAYLLELIDVTEQIDAFIPTCTLIGLWVGWRKGLLSGKGEGKAGAPARGRPSR